MAIQKIVREGVNFDGTSTRIPLGTADDLGIRDNDFTIEAWIKGSDFDTGTRRVVVGTEDVGTNCGLHLTIENRVARFGFYGNDTAGTTILPQNTWLHITWRFTKSSLRQEIFINGVLESSAAVTSSYRGTGMLWIGHCFGNGSFKGTIDEVRVFDYARTVDEINADMDRRLSGREPGLRRQAILADTTATSFGGTEYFNLANAADLGLTGGDFTVEAWVNCTNLSTTTNLGHEPTVLGADSPADKVARRGLHLLLRNSKACFNFYDDDLQGNVVLQNGVWTHIAWRYTSATRQQAIFINGILDTARIASGPLSGTGLISVGRSFGENYFRGILSDVRVWKTARTDEQIRRTMARRLRGDETGLAGYWKFDDWQGFVMADSTIHARHATGAGSPSVVAAGLPLDSTAPDASVLWLQKGHIELGNARDLGLLGGDFTVEAWVNCENPSTGTSGNDAAILGADVEGGHVAHEALHLVLRSGKACLNFFYDDLTANTEIKPNQWYHIAWRYTSATREQAIYINGKLDAARTAGGPLSNTGLISIGRCFERNYFRGMLSDLRIWRTARSAEQIRSAMGRRLCGDEAGLAGYWPLTGGPIAHDATINHRSGKLQGDIAWKVARPQIRSWCVGLASVTHEGKALVFGTDGDGAVHYTVRQSGFEDTAVGQATLTTGWEDFKTLPLPSEADDDSVVKKEKAELTRQSDTSVFILRSLYKTADASAAAPVQVVSAMGHLYVFRQSKNGTLLCDRFVLDGMTNTLMRKIEVRFKRSRKRNEPYEPGVDADPGAQVFDSMDFTDTAGQPFYEPTTELCFINQLHDGWFSVVVLPTSDPDRQRWHIFAYNRSLQAVQVISIRASKDGLFDPQDHRSGIDPFPSIEGIQRRTLDLQNGSTGARVLGPPAATRYDLQQEVLTASGEKQLIRTASKVMLAIPTDQGTAALSFAVSTDGTLSDLDASGDALTPLRVYQRELLLPLSSLDDIRPMAATPPVSGVINALSRASSDNVRLHVAAHTGSVSSLSTTDSVTISGTEKFNGQRTVTRVDDNTIDVDFTFGGAAMGQWKQVQTTQTGVIYDGTVTAVARTPEGKLRISAFHHGLTNDDAVQVVGTISYDGTYPIVAVSADQFEINCKWQPGTAVNVSLQSQRRRGLQLNHEFRQYVAAKPASTLTGDIKYTIEAWIKPAWMGMLGIAGFGSYWPPNRGAGLRLSANGLHHMWSSEEGLSAQTGNLANKWHHVAATYDGTQRRIFLNGKLLVSDTPTSKLAVDNSHDSLTIGVTNGLQEFFTGTIAEVRVWNLARTEEQILGAMHQKLTGQELGLCGYWPLGGVLEGDKRTVADFSLNQNDGVVVGGAVTSEVSLPRRPSGWTQDAVIYSNGDLVAVTQGATYIESFEYKVEGGGGDAGALPFQFVYWGKASRDAGAPTPFPDGMASPLAPQPIPNGNGWMLARCVFTVPSNVAYVRAFEIAAPDGSWTSIAVRRHRLQEQPPGIAERSRTNTVAPPVIADNQKGASCDLRILETMERMHGTLRKEYATLQTWIDAVVNNTAQTELNKAQTAYGNLYSERESKKIAYDTLKADPKRSYCKYLAKHSDKALDVQNARTDNLAPIQQWEYGGGSNQLFKCIPGKEAGYWRIQNKKSHKVLGLNGGSTDWTTPVVQGDQNDQPDQDFKFEYYPADQEVFFLIIPRHAEGCVLDVDHSLQDNGAAVHLFDKRYYTNQRFKRVPVEDSEDMAELLNGYNALAEPLAVALAERDHWQDIVTNGQTNLATWRARQQVIQGIMAGYETTMNTVNGRVLQAVLSQQSAAGMAMTTLATDARGLVTKGAFLEMVRPTSGLNALESCEGQVQLTYVDGDGRMRLTCYDATASSGSSYEAWRPDRLRACLNLPSNNCRVDLHSPVVLGNEWTIEAWFHYPLPFTEPLSTSGPRLNALVSGDDVHIQIRNNQRLGSYTNSTTSTVTEPFLDCGFDLQTLSPGWHHIAAVASGGGSGDATSTTTFYIDGVRVGDTKGYATYRQQRKIEVPPENSTATGERAKLDLLKTQPFKATGSVTRLGNAASGKQQAGKLAEVRIWGTALRDVEVAAHSKMIVTGNEPDLLAYFPLSEATGSEVRDGTGSGLCGTAVPASWLACTAAIGRPDRQGTAVVSTEYSTITVDAAGQRRAIMRRCLSYLSDTGIEWYSDKRVEALDLLWLGNAQFKPTLLGYIEGAPPVPSENLTQQDNYDNASSVQLTMAEDMSYSWSLNKEYASKGSFEGFFGVDTEAEAGFMLLGAALLNKLQFRFGAKLETSGGTADQRGSQISANEQRQSVDKLSLRGAKEATAHFATLGIRYVPKNIGYALVISGTADVFATRLKRSKRMVGYEVQPSDSIPPDINTITFLINPTYTLNGSLDGLTGTAAASERLFGHVPAMRAQYGSRYPASYYRVGEAYDLKAQIEAQDRKRQAYFFNFNPDMKYLGTVGDDHMAKRIDKSGGDDVSVGLRRPEDSPPPTSGGSGDGAPPGGDQTPDASNPGPSDEDNAALQSAMAERKDKIQNSLLNIGRQAEALHGLDQWQKRMEDLLTRAGKRNIVNTYVWDSDGGFHSETQQFASVIQHTIGSSANVSFAMGIDGKILSGGVGGEFKALGGLSMTQTFTKTLSDTRGFSLDVDLSGVESQAVTDFKLRPSNPGEKVGRYRLMSFYLEGSTQNFNDFFSYVVDPEWLAGNSECARALRQVDRSKKNPAWRVLHRVTYVERPALQGFGVDTRTLAAQQEQVGPMLSEKLNQLLKDNAAIRDVIAQILAKLQTQQQQ